MMTRHHRVLVWLLMAALLLVACSDNGNNSDDPAPTAIPSPTLLVGTDPLDNTIFGRFVEDFALQWEYPPELSENEFFDVRLWRDGDPALGITWTKERSFDLRNWLFEQTAGTFHWSVTVIETRDVDGNTEIVRAIESTPDYTFTINPAFYTTLDGAIQELPAGFKSTLYALGPQEPTVITEGPDGTMYVAALNGDIFILIDDNNDGVAERTQLVFRSAGDLTYLAGMTFDDEGTLFVSDSGRIGIITDSEGDGIYETHTTLVDGLPSWQYWAHSNNGIAFGPDGKLYIGVGATTDHGPLQDELEASILRMNPDGSELEVFATGFRNPYDIAFSPDGELFAVDNNADRMDADLPYLPAEELNHVREGLDYGFPEVYSPPMNGYGDTEPPVTMFLASVGSSGLVYYDHDHFPEPYNDGLYAAQWGGNGFLEQLPNGNKIVYVTLEPDGDTFVGKWEVFVQFDIDAAGARPVDVTVGSDGHLYIAEFRTGAIYRIEYTGATTPETDENNQDIVQIGQQLYNQGVNGAPNCIACHNNAAIAPLLDNIGNVATTRVDGMTAADYLYESIVQPNAYIVEGYNAGAMFAGYGDALTDEQLDTLIAYLLSLQE